MFLEESNWILEKVSLLNPCSSILDIGSSNIFYRTKKQPYINHMYKKIEALTNIKISSVDFYESAGVNIVCDVTDRNCLHSIRPKTCGLLLICNLLEHVELERISILLENMHEILMDDGYCVVTVPYNIEYHESPIDNGLRPTAKELISIMSPNFKVLSCEQIECSHYREPFISHPEMRPMPLVTCGVFQKK